MSWVKSRIEAERAAVVGFLVTVIWFVSDGLQSGEWTNWQTLVPLATGLVIRLFVTSEGVEPGL